MGRLSQKEVKERKAVAAAFVEPILGGLRDRKVSGSYKRMTPGKNGILHTQLSPDTASNRLSSSESALFPNSTNMQNAEKKVARLDPLYNTRDVIVPKKGMVLLAGDYAGAEAIGVAAYSKDWIFLDKLLAGADVHTEHCLLFWGSLADDDNERKLFRDIAKTVTYASFYYAKVRTVTINLNKEADRLKRFFTEKEVADLLAKLYSLHPLQEWWQETRRALEANNGTLRNCFGYRRTFRDPEPDNRLKDALSFFPQSTVGSLMNEALPKLYSAIDKPGARELLHQVHDEALFQCYEDEIPYVVKTAKPILERPFKIHGRELHIPVEWKYGSDWGSGMKFKLVA